MLMARHYLTILTIHSYWRWVVPASLVVAAITGLLGLAARWPFAPVGPSCVPVGYRSGRRTVCPRVVPLCDQHARALGLGEHVGCHEAARPALLFVEHPTAMLLTVAAAHVGSWRSRRTQADYLAYLNMAGWFGMALACVLIGIPWWRPFLRALSFS